MRKGIFERAYLNWHYRKDILMKDISERAFPKGHFDEGHFEGRAFPKGERAKGMKGIVHKLEFSQSMFPDKMNRSSAKVVGRRLPNSGEIASAAIPPITSPFSRNQCILLPR